VLVCHSDQRIEPRHGDHRPVVGWRAEASAEEEATATIASTAHVQLVYERLEAIEQSLMAKGSQGNAGKTSVGKQQQREVSGEKGACAGEKTRGKMILSHEDIHSSRYCQQRQNLNT